MKILVFGASGSGTSTLSNALAFELDCKHLDSDDYYWAKTEIPFSQKLPLSERQANLRRDFEANPDVIVSGSLAKWDIYWNTAFDLGIFLLLPQAIRMERLRKREYERYGDALEHNQELKAQSHAFLQWAEQYEDPDFTGRNIAQHRKWITTLDCEIIEIIGDLTNKERIQVVIKHIKSE